MRYRKKADNVPFESATPKSVNNGECGLANERVNRAINYFRCSLQEKINSEIKLVAFNGFRSDIDRFSTSNEIAQWSRRFFFSPSTAHVLVLREALWRERQHSLDIVSILFAGRPIHVRFLPRWKSLTQRQGKKPAKNIFAQWTAHN